MRRFPLRPVRGLLVAAGLLLGTSSSVALHPFVASGEYARARALVADCSRPFFPAARASDLPAPRTGVARFASFEPSGAHLPYIYRARAAEPGVTVRSGDEDAVPWAEIAPGTRLDSYEAPNEAMTVASTVERTAAGAACKRVVVYVDPAKMQVGVPKDHGVNPTGKFVDFLYSGTQGVTGEAKDLEIWARTVTPVVDPNTIRANVVVRAYVDGQPAAGQKVIVWGDARGTPGSYGRTYPHNHLVATAQLAPSFRFVGTTEKRPTVTMDARGEHKLKISPGYRGGPESLLAQFADDPSVRTARSVIIKHLDAPFVHWALDEGFSSTNRPVPSAKFPFLLVGYTDAHMSNHWVRADKIKAIKNIFRQIWEQDPNRTKAGPSHYWILNDMSLEYGGIFHVSASSSCTTHGTRSHHTHTFGTDFDVAPCYSNGLNAVNGPTCEHRRRSEVHIDERVLAAHIIGRGGSIFEHHETTNGFSGRDIRVDGAPYHYHIRFPEGSFTGGAATGG